MEEMRLREFDVTSEPRPSAGQARAPRHIDYGTPLGTTTTCQKCGLYRKCLPAQLDPVSLDCLECFINHRRHVPSGGFLYRSGSRFASLFVLRSGCLKTVHTFADGRFRVTGFHLAGDIVGFDGLGGGEHTCDAITLQDCNVCEMPFEAIQQLSTSNPQLQRYFHRVMGREIAREHATSLLLASTRATERVAAFLLHLSNRYEALGKLPGPLRLRMTRGDVGSYLGLCHETVSRALSQLQDDGLIRVKGRKVEIVDFDGLTGVVEARGHADAGASCSRIEPAKSTRVTAAPRRRSPAMSLLS